MMNTYHGFFLISLLEPTVVEHPRTSGARMKGFRRRFTRTEDSQLLHYVLEYGDNNWGYIAEQMGGGFNARQCRERWRYYLDPDLGDTAWTNVEDADLLAKVEQFGAHWTTIAHHFPGRSGNTVRNRYQLLMRRKQKKESPPDGTERQVKGIEARNDSPRAEIFRDFQADDVMRLFSPST
jgi:hypothetical protein